MNQPVYRSRRDHGVLEDRFPLGERQIRGDQDAAAFVALGQEREEHVHLVPLLPDIADVIDDQGVVLREPLQHPWQLEVPLRHQELLDEETTGREVNLMALPYQRLPYRADEVRFPAPGVPKGQDILPPLQEASVEQRLHLVRCLRRKPLHLEPVQRLLQRKP